MTDWKPTEQNIGQPVLDTYPASIQNNTYIPPVGTLHIGSKWYDVDTTKLTSIKDVEALFSAIGMKVSETIENFDEVKHLLIIPEEPKTLDEISQELDEKIDELIENTKNKFYQSKYISEKLYNTKFDRIIGDFEYAKEHGSFPHKLTFTVGDGLSVNNWTTSNFVIKSTPMGAGYWDVKPNIQIWLQVKPNWLVRKCAKIFFDFGWKDG